MAVLKDQIKKLLATKGVKKFFFVYGLGKRKDGGEGELIVAGKKPKKAEVEEELTKCTEVFEGNCWTGSGTDNAETIYFQAKGKKLSAAIVAKMSKTAKQSCGRQYDFQLPSPEEETRAEKLAEGADDVGAEAPPPAPPAPPLPTQDGAAAKFATRLKTLTPVLQKAEATGTEPAKAARLRVVEATKAYQAAQYDQANALLDQAEALLKQALQAAPGSTTAPPEPKQTDAARFASRLKALAPVVQKAETTGSESARAAKLQIAEANKLYLAKQYTEANAALDRAEALIKQAFAGGAKGVSVMKLGKARIEWISVRTHFVQEMKRLQEALLREFGDDETQRPQLTAATRQCEALINAFNEQLADQLDAVLNAQEDGARTQLAATAKATMSRFSQVAQNDPLMKLLDGNEVLPDMQVAAPLQTKLNDIAAALG